MLDGYFQRSTTELSTNKVLRLPSFSLWLGLSGAEPTYGALISQVLSGGQVALEHRPCEQKRHHEGRGLGSRCRSAGRPVSIKLRSEGNPTGPRNFFVERAPYMPRDPCGFWIVAKVFAAGDGDPRAPNRPLSRGTFLFGRFVLVPAHQAVTSPRKLI